MEHSLIVDYLPEIRRRTKEAKSGFKEEKIKDGDFGYSGDKKAWLFLKHWRRDMVEAFCLCDSIPPCTKLGEMGERMVQGFGFDVNNEREKYSIVGNVEQFV